MLTPEFIEFCKEHENDDIYSLALQSSRYPDVDLKKAVQQIKGLQIAKTKLPSWYFNKNIIYPPTLALEQCSSELTAIYKQNLCNTGKLFVDLTGGLGVDTSFMSQRFEKAIYIEQQGALAALAQYNFNSLNLNHISIISSDSIDYLDQLGYVDLIYIDPARRDIAGKKTISIEDCNPNILEIQHKLDEIADAVMIKLSPMLDISIALKALTNVSSLHIVSAGNECKELLFIKNKKWKEEPIIHSINILDKNRSEKFNFKLSDEINATNNYATILGKYLYEPNASIMKAGAYKYIGQKYKMKKLHNNSHLYTSHSYNSLFPGRVFQIVGSSKFSKKEIKENLSAIAKANIITRNFPMKPSELANKIKVLEGGEQYIIATTLYDEAKILLLCNRLK